MKRFHLSGLRLRSLLLCLAVTLIVLCTGCFNRAEVLVSGPVEYSLSPVDASTVITCSEEDTKLELQDDIVASHVGTQQIRVKVGEGLFSKTKEVEVVVSDTQPPVIELTKSSVSAEMGTECDPHELIASVSDPVDGDLHEVTKEPEARGKTAGFEQFYDEGWYRLEGSFDIDTPGDYQLTVRACDQHGNMTTMPITVTITDPLAGVKLNKTQTVLEYGKDKVRPTTLVTCSIEGAKVRAKALSLAEVGLQKVKFSIKKGASTKYRTRTFKIVDTKVPSIMLKYTEVVVEQGTSYHPYSNVLEVTDPVDGSLSRVNKKPKALAKGLSRKAGQMEFYKKGWYLVSGTYDLSKVGSYPIEVLARDRHGNTTKTSFTLKVIDPLEGVKLTKTTDVLEYANADVDPTRFVTCSVEGAKVTAGKLSLRSVGSVKVTFTITKGSSKRTSEQTFTVRDTKAPNIVLSTSDMQIEAGSSFNRFDNVISVTDPVDGQLEEVASEPAGGNGDGWYTVTGSCDTSRAGRYYLTVVACDRNGNRVTKDYSVLVTNPEPIDDGQDYVLNTNTMTFHYPGCRDVNRMAPYNRREVHMTRDEVISQGYSSCGHCNP